MNKIKGFLLFISLLAPILLFAQDVKSYAIHKFNKIEYRKVYPSTFPGKAFVINNWISETFNIKYFDEANQSNIIRFINILPIENKENNYNFSGELSFTINIWCKDTQFQLFINNLYYLDKTTKENTPLELLSDSNDYKLIHTASKNYIDSIIKNFELYIEPYIEKRPDLLVKKDFDTLKCTIKEENSDRINYILFSNQDSTIHTLDKSEIFSIQKHEDIAINSFQEFPELPLDQNKKKIEKTKFYRSSLELNFGYCRRVSPMSRSVDSNLKEYIDGLRIGYGFTCNYNYYLKNNIGIGLNISGAFSHDSTSYLYNYSGLPNSSRYVPLEEKIEIIIIAPSFSYRIPFNNKRTIFHPKVFVGYLNYTDIINILTIVKGKTFCTGVSLGMDHVLGKNFIIGYSFSYISGSLGKIKTGGKVIELEEKEGLDRVEFNIGLRFYMNFKK